MGKSDIGEHVEISQGRGNQAEFSHLLEQTNQVLKYMLFGLFFQHTV
jgi:hypothetical protein